MYSSKIVKSILCNSSILTFFCRKKMCQEELLFPCCLISTAEGWVGTHIYLRIPSQRWCCSCSCSHLSQRKGPEDCDGWNKGNSSPRLQLCWPLPPKWDPQGTVGPTARLQGRAWDLALGINATLLLNHMSTSEYLGLRFLYGIWKVLSKADSLLQYQAEDQHRHVCISEIIDTDLRP